MIRLTILSALVGTLFIGTNCAAQLELSHWHFGDGIGLDFNGGEPVLETSNTDAGFSQCPTSISDSDGNLLLYCDGSDVYNANHDVIENGSFGTTSNENLLVKDPSSDDRYYLFRSHAGEANYSIIDLTLDDGNGAIETGMKDIEFHDTECELFSARNENGIDNWIFTADNDPLVYDDVIHINVYALTADGIELSSEMDEEWFFADWNTTLDDARISPDCSRIAISFKGHYVCFMRFDNEEGVVYDVLADEMDTQASFVNITELEFSGNSERLYALGDYNTIRQYDLTTWNINSISASGTIIEQGDINTNWRDLKLAPNGKIYLANSASDQLDVINQPDMEGIASDFEEAVLSIPSNITTYFPNTPNVLCGEPFLDLQILHQYVCLGDSTEIWYSYAFDPDSVLWEFGDPDTGVNNMSTEDETIHVFSDIGTFDVTLHFYIDGNETLYDHEITIYEQPNVDLGNDIEMCQGESVELSSGYPNMENLWNNGETSESIFVGSTGDFWVQVDNNGCIHSDTVHIEVIPYASIDVGEWIVTCEDDPITLTADVDGIEDVVWNTGATTLEIVVNQSGYYWASGENDCFSASDSILVEFIDVPQTFLQSDAQLCEGDSLPVNINYPNWDVEWDNGSSANPLVITEEGTYTATISYGDCEATDEITVEFSDYVALDNLLLPNVFTPNEDDRNTEFRPFLANNPEESICGVSTLDVDLQVYNRWGNLLADDVCSWRGNNEDGKPMAEGVYYYIIDLRSLCLGDNEEIQKAGHFTLLRK